MEYLYHDYVPTVGNHVIPHDSMDLAPRRDYQHVTTQTAARFHPYGRSQQLQMQPVNRNYDFYTQYQHSFDSSNQQLPMAYNDVTIDPSLSSALNWYPNTLGYSYPNLTFLQEASLKPGQETGLFGGKAPSLETGYINSQAFLGLGENYEQHPSFDPRRKGADASVGHIRTRDKYRVVYTDEQKIALEEEYDKTPFITEKRREELAKEVSLSERQIKFWFQNRRVKDRRGKNAKTQKRVHETTKRSESKNQHCTGAGNINNIETKNQQAADDSNHVGVSDQVSTNRPPCRFSDQHSRSPTDPKFEAYAYSGNILFPAQTSASPPSYGAGPLPESGVRYPVSPSDWNLLSETSLLTALNVSPILTTGENDLNSRS